MFLGRRITIKSNWSCHQNWMKKYVSIIVLHYGIYTINIYLSTENSTYVLLIINCCWKTEYFIIWWLNSFLYTYSEYIHYQGYLWLKSLQGDLPVPFLKTTLPWRYLSRSSLTLCGLTSSYPGELTLASFIKFISDPIQTLDPPLTTNN